MQWKVWPFHDNWHFVMLSEVQTDHWLVLGSRMAYCYRDWGQATCTSTDCAAPVIFLWNTLHCLTFMVDNSTCLGDGHLDYIMSTSHL